MIGHRVLQAVAKEIQIIEPKGDNPHQLPFAFHVVEEQ
jgi:hypothetical protein